MNYLKKSIMAIASMVLGCQLSVAATPTTLSSKAVTVNQATAEKYINQWLADIYKQIKGARTDATNHWASLSDSLGSTSDTNVTVPSTVSGRGNGDVDYKNRLHSVLCDGASANNVACSALSSASGDVLSTSVMPFSNTAQSSGDAGNYIKTLLKKPSKQAGSNDVSSHQSLAAAKSLVVQVLSDIASENQAVGTLKSSSKSSSSTGAYSVYSTKYASANQALASLLSSGTVKQLSSSKNLLTVLKGILHAQATSAVNQNAILQQVQTQNALSAAVLSQLIAVREQNARLIAQNKVRNNYLDALTKKKTVTG